MLGLAGFFFAAWAISVLLRTPSGTILVENVPEGAQVLVDGEAVSITRDHDTVTIRAVNKGNHKLEITRDGKSFWTKELTIDFDGHQVTATYSPFATKQSDRTETDRPPKTMNADVAPPNIYVPPAGGKPIDLLALVDLKTDAIGIWSRRGRRDLPEER